MINYVLYANGFKKYQIVKKMQLSSHYLDDPRGFSCDINVLDLFVLRRLVVMTTDQI